MNAAAKLLLLTFGLAPFFVLAGNAFRKVSFNFVYAVFFCTLGGGTFYYLFGMDRHPYVSQIFLALFLLWPIALIAAKIINPSLSWICLWLSVPLMSWLTCTVGVAVDYPADGSGGGLGMLITLALSWFYLIPVFGVLCLLYLAAAYLWPKLKLDPLKEKEALSAFP